jgi:hypothetical protein
MLGHKKGEISIPNHPPDEKTPVSEVNVILFVKEAAPPQIQQITKELQEIDIMVKKLTDEKRMLEELLAVVTKQR